MGFGGRRRWRAWEHEVGVAACGCVPMALIFKMSQLFFTAGLSDPAYTYSSSPSPPILPLYSGALS